MNEFVEGTDTKPAAAGPAPYETDLSTTELGCWLKAIHLMQF